MSKSIAPSSLARTIAAQQWPDVQEQHKVARGVYQFSCAGHGGLIGIVSELDYVKPEFIEAARRSGNIVTVLRAPSGRNRSRYFSSAQGYSADDLRSYEHRPECDLFEVWIGEEDCDWAQLAYAAGAVLAGLNEGRDPESESYITRDYVRDSLEHWNNSFLADVETEVAA